MTSFEQWQSFGGGVLHLTDVLIAACVATYAVGKLAEAYVEGAVAKYRPRPTPIEPSDPFPIAKEPSPDDKTEIRFHLGPIYHSYRIGGEVYFCNGAAIDERIKVMQEVRINGNIVPRGSIHKLDSNEYFDSMPDVLREAYLTRMSGTVGERFFYRVAPF